VTVTATVMNVDQKTRAVTLKSSDGHEDTFIAGDEVKNLAQVKKGDLVKTTYKESLVYEVKKGGAAAGAETTTTIARGRPGSVPAGVWAQRTTVTVLITAIDPKAPTITFKGPAGNTRTIRVQDPAKLQGISVGDTVEIVYVEAVAIKVERAPKT
jgi:Cu/Ag efflux protein CusF